MRFRVINTAWDGNKHVYIVEYLDKTHVVYRNYDNYLMYYRTILIKFGEKGNDLTVSCDQHVSRSVITLYSRIIKHLIKDYEECESNT